MSKRNEIAQRLGELLTARGADRYSCEVTEEETHEFNVENGSFSLLRTVFSTDVSLWVFMGRKMGKANGNDVSEDGLAALADSAVATAASAEEDPAWDLAPEQGRETVSRGPMTPDMDRLFSRTTELLDTIARDYPQIMVTRLMTKYTRSHSLYSNTNGTMLDESHGLYDIMVEFAGREGENTTSLNYVYFLTDQLDVPFIGQADLRQNLENTRDSLRAENLAGKFKGTAILMPECLDAFLWSLISICMSDQVVMDGTSPWLDRVGEQVAHEALTLSLTPGDPRILAGETHTASGFRSEDCTLIEKGVLKAHMLSLYAANRTGRPVMKNTGFSLAVAPGKKSLDEMIRGVKKGILVGYFSGGEPASNGEFSGIAKNSFLIEDGRLAGALSETMINGNLEQVFRHIAGISREVRVNGQTLLPWVAVDGVVISGK